MSYVPSNDPSKYTQVRLIIDGAGESSIYWTVIVRTVGGGQRRDRVRLKGVAPSPPGGLASMDAVEALLAAADQLRARSTPRP